MVDDLMKYKLMPDEGAITKRRKEKGFWLGCWLKAVFRMKKILIVSIVSIVLAFGLLGCSTESDKEKAINEAIDIQANDIQSQMVENSAKAKQEWNGKTVRYTGVFYQVRADKAQMYQDTYRGKPLNAILVELSEEELVTLELGHTYTVVGVIEIDNFIIDINDAFIVEE